MKNIDTQWKIKLLFWIFACQVTVEAVGWPWEHEMPFRWSMPGIMFLFSLAAESFVAFSSITPNLFFLLARLPEANLMNTIGLSLFSPWLFMLRKCTVFFLWGYCHCKPVCEVPKGMLFGQEIFFCNWMFCDKTFTWNIVTTTPKNIRVLQSCRLWWKEVIQL